MTFGAVIVNFNCARFALDAALSVLGDDEDARVVIVDNLSTDDSRDYLKKALCGALRRRPSLPRGAEIAPRFALLEDAASGGAAGTAGARLSYVEAEKNAGFAAGCNIGVRCLQRMFDPDMYVLLNPDAVLGAGALDAFRDRLGEEEAGLCGASVFRYDDPQCAQAFGGARLHPFTLLGENIAAGRTMRAAPAREEVEAAMSYPLGAAMAFRKDYLDIAGYLDERFFLYYEEADWARRGAPQRRPVWAPQAVAYHRHGAAAGSRVAGGARPPHRSPLSDYHMARSRMLYAMKWRPWLAPFLVAGGAFQSMRRVARGHWRQAGAVLSGSVSGASGRAS